MTRLSPFTITSPAETTLFCWLS
ncbi:hypothetical protein D018_0610A, partial [Vibrio parahaemolyticus VP2007-007]